MQQLIREHVHGAVIANSDSHVAEKEPFTHLPKEKGGGHFFEAIPAKPINSTPRHASPGTLQDGASSSLWKEKWAGLPPYLTHALNYWALTHP